MVTFPLRKTLLATAAICVFAASSQAAVIVTWTQDGSDVVATYSGTMAGSPFAVANINQHGVGSATFINFTNPGGLTAGFTANASSLASVTASSYYGDNFGFTSSYLHGPSGFNSSTPVSGWMRFSDTTLEAMGAVFASDFVALQTSGGTPFVTYEANAVPEPSTWALLGAAAVGGLAMFRRRRVRGIAGVSVPGQSGIGTSF